MSYRITNANLEGLANSINAALGHGHSDMYGGINADKSRVVNAGFVYISSQNGLARFEQMCAGGGASNLTLPGTKRQAWEQGQAFLSGLRAGVLATVAYLASLTES